MSDTATLSVHLINACSFRNNQRRIDLELHSIHCNPEILAICETWFTDDIKFRLKGYSVFRNDRKSIIGRNYGGGTALLIKESYSAEQLILNFNPKSFECSIATVYLSNGPPMVIVAIYRPPPTVFNSDELDRLLDFCETKSQTILIAGDFNSFHRNWNSTRDSCDGNKLNDWIMSRGLLVYPTTQPTRGNNHLDFFIASPAVIAEENLLSTMAGFSDHRVVVFELVSNGIPLTKTAKKSYNWKKTDISKFQQHIDAEMMYLDVQLNEDIDPDQIDIIVDELKQGLNRVLDI